MKPERSTEDLVPYYTSSNPPLPKATFLNLPITVIEDYICSRIQTHEEFQNVTLVCKQFKKAAYQTYYYKHFILKFPNSETLTLYLSEARLLISRHEKIDLADSQINNNGLVLLSEKTRTLTDCRFTWCILLTPEAFIAFFKKASQLTNINLDYCYDVNADVLNVISNACPKLEKLSLSHLNKITIESILNILDKCPNMKELTLRATYNLNDDRIVDIFKKGKNLERVDLSHASYISNEILQRIIEAISQHHENHRRPFELIIEKNNLLKDDYIKALQETLSFISIQYTPLPTQLNQTIFV